MQQTFSFTVSLVEARDLFITAIQAEGFSPATVANYESSLGLFIRFLHEQGVHHLQEVTPAHVRAWLVHKREQGVSQYHLHNCYRLPRRWWRWLMDEGLVQHDAFANVKKPRPPQLVKPALTDEQVKALLKATEGKDWLSLRNRALVMLLLTTGLRAIEAHRLTVRDVQGDAIQVQGKGNKQRFVPLLPEVRLALKRYLTLCPFKPAENDPLWWGVDGALSLDAVKHCIYDLSRRAGVQAGSHALRRTFATRLLQEGVSMEHVRMLLGHSGYAVLRQYLVLGEADLRKAVQEHNPLKRLTKR
jgi:site-specific recombinase XerD